MAHSVAHSTQMSNRKTSSMFEGKAMKTDKHHAGNVAGAKAGTLISSGEGGSQVCMYVCMYIFIHQTWIYKSIQ